MEIFRYIGNNWHVQLRIKNNFTRFELSITSLAYSMHQYFGGIDIDNIELFLPSVDPSDGNLSHFFLTDDEKKLVKEWAIEVSIPTHVKREETINKLLSEK